MDVKFEMNQKQIVPQRCKLLVGICCLLAVIAVGSGIVRWLLRVNNIADVITVEAGTESVDASAFLIRDYGLPVSFVTDMSELDWNNPGDYPVQISYNDRIYDAVVQVRDTQAPAAVVSAQSTLSVIMPEPESFLLEIHDATAVTVEYVLEPDLAWEGEQTVALLLTDEGGNCTQVQASLTVIRDTEAPAIEGITPLNIFLGNNADYFASISAHDDWDESPQLTVDDSAVDLTRAGVYEIEYRARDASGNEASGSTVLTIVEDRTAPEILGVNPISVCAGSSVAYRSGILVRDDLDDRPALYVDSSGVDLSRPGTYELIYRAEDAAGNKSSIATTVTVTEKTDEYVDKETIYAAADAILAEIVQDGMTDREKAEAIYRWEKNHLTYSGSSVKTDWLQAAYTMIKRRSGDCFNYYAVARLMFDRLGIPNMTVLRSEDSVRAGSHYWNLVSVDGGETFYHFDSTPRSASYGGNRNFCLVTDAVLDAYDRYYPGYYTRDLTLYPATPEE